MTIENTVTSDFGLRSSIVLTFSIATYPCTKEPVVFEYPKQFFLEMTIIILITFSYLNAYKLHARMQRRKGI